MTETMKPRHRAAVKMYYYDRLPKSMRDTLKEKAMPLAAVRILAKSHHIRPPTMRELNQI